MKAFQIQHFTRTNHCIRWQLPVSKRVHHIGTFGFDGMHESLVDIRHQFVFFIAAAVAEIGYCSEVAMVKESCLAMHEYMCNRFAGRGKEINFHDAIGEFIRFHNHVEMRITDAHHREYLHDIREWVILFQLNWNDYKMQLLPTTTMAMAA